MAGVSADVSAGVRRPAWARRPSRPVVIVAIVAVWVVVGSLTRGRDTQTLAVSDPTKVTDWFGSVRDWVDSQRYTNPFFVHFVDVILRAVSGLTTFMENIISQASFGRPVPLIGWLGVVALATLAAYAFGSVRVAGLTAVGLVAIGVLGLWPESMDTLAQMLSAVVISVVIGIPLGIWIGLTRWVSRVATPVLDAMQAMPAVVYLTPLSLLFGIGPPAAVIVTVIYAMPPVIRLTAHGIREVSDASLEASRSMGATRWQLLRTVQLPLAKRTIVVGVNQTTMAALSMLMIAVLIGAPGLGPIVLRGLETSDVGTAFTAGLAVVILGIILDRVTTAASRRVEARYRAGARASSTRNRRYVLGGAGVLALIAVYLSYSYYWASIFPGRPSGSAVGDAVSTGVSNADDWIRGHLFTVTDAIKNGVTYGLINPLQALLADSPWYLVCAVILALAWTLAGARILIVTSVCLALLFGSGLWESAMETLTSVLVATILVMVLGVVFGVMLARSRLAELILRPALDAAQALPAFVYLIPVLGLFGPSRMTGIIAGVVFAAPVAIKIVADGILGVPAVAIDAAVAAGSSRWQVITMVQLPLSRKTVALAANQGLVYVLSVVTLGGLVGAGALGYLTIAGFAQSDLWGKGFVAGVDIVVLFILLDRVAQAAVRRAEEREHRTT